MLAPPALRHGAFGGPPSFNEVSPASGFSSPFSPGKSPFLTVSFWGSEDIPDFGEDAKQAHNEWGFPQASSHALLGDHPADNLTQ